ncbi:MAG: FAD-dependent oxidoreductase, partial [Cyanobacteria bacterium]|nr:FAD-dependent oxidoreductase [Cyanobacteriota bacterium]
MVLIQEHAAVVVWGGGTGGVAAALQSARSGAPTLLLTPGPWLGGMVSAAGVCAPDGNELSCWQTGLWGAFLRDLQRQEPEGLDQNWVSCFGYRPATAEAILRRWLGAEPLLRWWPEVRLLAAKRHGRRVAALDIEREGETLRLDLDLLIDGSDLGDLFPLVGAPYRLGWEPQETWAEPSAPSLQAQVGQSFFHQQVVQSPTWVVMGQLGKGACPTGSTLPAPFTAASEAFGLERTLTYGRLPGGLVMLNWPLQGNDWHQDLAAAFQPGSPDYGELMAAMRAHSEAFLEGLITATDGWLQPAQVFPMAQDPLASGRLQGPGSLALMPYWREGRRLVGLEVVIEQQLLPCTPGEAIAPLPLDGAGAISSIAVGNYPNDHHYPGADWPLAAKSCRWGGRWSGTPFCIPYGALVSAGIDNLLAADKCFSSSHMANGATRLQPLILNIGQAAGLAAALCWKNKIPPAALPVRQLQEALLSDPLAPAGPVPLWDTPWHHPRWAERQRRVLDDPSLL